MSDLAWRLEVWGAAPDSVLPRPGAGSTGARFLALMEQGRQDLSLARIVEAHTDALAILAEAGHTARPGAWYGVWAADGPQGMLTARPSSDGHWRLDGLKQYCSGATFLTAALVTAHCDGAVWLFEVPLDGPGLRVLPSTWASPAMADTATGPVEFAAVSVPGSARVGGPQWYLDRPGFWHGAIGPAACWAGGALSLVEMATALGRKDAHSRAQVGALQAAAWGMRALLLQAGAEIDSDPGEGARPAQIRALKVRHLIERQCTEVCDRFGRATGPQLLAYDARAISQYLALQLYIRQCHGERDLAALAQDDVVGVV